MNILPLFLNELSCAFEDIAVMAMRECIINTILTIREIRKIRYDFIFFLFNPLGKIVFGSGQNCLTLASLIGGGEYQDYWRFLKSVIQSSPNDTFTPPLSTEEICYNEKASLGLTWAWKNNSLVVSFGYAPHWNSDMIQASLCMQVENGFTTRPISIPNLSQHEHIQIWEQNIRDYGINYSPSTLIYEGDSFTARMFFRDHNPPHIHIFGNNHSSDVIARLNIRTMEFLEINNISICNAVLIWARSCQDQLLDNWSRCISGQHLVRL